MENKRPVQCSWMRQGQRKRLRRTSELQDELIVQHSVHPRDKCFENKHHQDASLFRMPEEVLMLIFDLLPYGDVLSMTRTCKDMAEFVSRNFVPSLILPTSSQNLEKLDGRKVLCIKSEFNVLAQEKIKNGEYISDLANINLSSLQKIVFVGNEELNRNQFGKLCKRLLTHYLSVAKQLTDYHVANMQLSEETVNVFCKIVEGVPFLSNIQSSRDQAEDDRSFSKFFV